MMQYLKELEQVYPYLHMSLQFYLTMLLVTGAF